MMKIPCGGFYIDEESLEINDNVLSVKNGGSSGLPTVTEDDNGDVLTVVEGEWGKATPSSKSDIFTVTFTYDDNTGTIIVDKTYAEIVEAVETGLLVTGVYGEYDFYELNCVGEDSITFTQYFTDDEGYTVANQFFISSEDEVTTANYNVPNQHPNAVVFIQYELHFSNNTYTLYDPIDADLDDGEIPLIYAPMDFSDPVSGVYPMGYAYLSHITAGGDLVFVTQPRLVDFATGKATFYEIAVSNWREEPVVYVQARTFDVVVSV